MRKRGTKSGVAGWGRLLLSCFFYEDALVAFVDVADTCTVFILSRMRTVSSNRLYFNETVHDKVNMLQRPPGAVRDKFQYAPHANALCSLAKCHARDASSAPPDIPLSPSRHT